MDDVAAPSADEVGGKASKGARIQDRFTGSKLISSSTLGSGGGWMSRAYTSSWSEWRDDQGRPFGLCVLAGGCASATVDVTIHPLDTLKTRLQAPNGFVAAGGYRGLFRGVLAAALGAIPGGAVFFGTYEFTKHVVTPVDQGDSGGAHFHWWYDAVAATSAATASCLVRTPAAVVTQRMQVGQYHTFIAATSGIAAGGPLAFYRGLGASVARELPFAFIQFPMYEQLKRLLTPASGEEISPAQGAVCGSFSGAVAAAATTPFDTLKTRQMLGTELGLVALTREIIRKEGLLVLFSGMGPRVGWMTIGGCIFFGVYEQCMLVLTQLHRAAERDPVHGPESQGLLQTLRRGMQLRRTPPSEEPPLPLSPHDSRPATTVVSPMPAAATEAAAEATSEPVAAPVALLSGGLAGMMIDCILYPVDTFKTRSIQGVAPVRLREFFSLWNGLGAALLPAVPAAGAFFFTYEGVKGLVERNVAGGGGAATPLVAAAVAEAVCCIVRVPAEFVKFRLQVNKDARIAAVLESTWSQGGFRALYKGLGATLVLDLPFAMIQFPLFEALKGVIQDIRHGTVGAAALCVGLATVPTSPSRMATTQPALNVGPS